MPSSCSYRLLAEGKPLPNPDKLDEKKLDKAADDALEQLLKKGKVEIR